MCANAPGVGRRVASARGVRLRRVANATAAALFIDFRQQHLPTHPPTHPTDGPPARTNRVFRCLPLRTHTQSSSHLLIAPHLWLLLTCAFF